jgi:hypothetical protein
MMLPRLLLQDAHRQRIVDWCDAVDGAAAAFDFTTKGVLQEAVAKREYWRLRDAAGRPPGMIGWWPSRAVTFIDNHDTGSTQSHWPFPAQSLHQAKPLMQCAVLSLHCMCAAVVLPRFVECAM